MYLVPSWWIFTILQVYCTFLLNKQPYMSSVFQASHNLMEASQSYGYMSIAPM